MRSSTTLSLIALTLLPLLGAQTSHAGKVAEVVGFGGTQVREVKEEGKPPVRPERAVRRKAKGPFGARLLLDAIANRKSPRAFKRGPIAREKLASLELALTSGASAFGRRPFRVIVMERRTNPEGYEKLYNLIVAKNQEWVARRPPVLILTTYEAAYPEGLAKFGVNARGEDGDNPAKHDLGVAIGTMTAQAESLGLGVRNMSGFDARAARTEFGIPDNYIPFSVVAVGHPASPKSLPRAIQEKEQKRRGLKAWSGPVGHEQVVSHGHW